MNENALFVVSVMDNLFDIGGGGHKKLDCIEFQKYAVCCKSCGSILTIERYKCLILYSINISWHRYLCCPQNKR